MSAPPDRNGKAVGLEGSNGLTEEQKNELHTAQSQTEGRVS
jgi:hypothetical protein